MGRWSSRPIALRELLVYGKELYGADKSLEKEPVGELEMEETFEFGKISGFPAQMEPSYTVTRGKEGVGLGFIWRDWSGKIIAACMIYIPTICSVILSEAEAIFTALKACPIDSSSFFEIRTDRKRLVDEFKEEGSNLSYVSLVFNKIKRHQRFPLCTKLNFVNRINNEIAHSLAKRSLENKLTQSFLNSFP
uniref:RNase H type-1 domain-containing protein n=1 Tax=Cannabis sativa TaxID=3483 RepID=A0A803PZC0_CANSA